MEKFKKDLREFLKLEKKDVKYVPVKRLYKDFDYPEREREAKEDQEIRELFEERRPKRQKLKFKSKRKNKSTRKKSKAKSKARRKKSKAKSKVRRNKSKAKSKARRKKSRR